MDSRTSMSSDIPSELSAHSGTTLDALGQAASKAEQAAYRYRANTALPFTQLDFEAEHPEWSLSAHRTSSASSSRPASANSTIALFSRSSTSSASNRNLASASGRAAFPSSPIQVAPRAQGSPRKPYLKEQGFSEPDKKRAYSGGEPGHLGKADGRAMKQCYRDQRSAPKDAAQYLSPTIRPFTMSNRKSLAGGVSNLSVSPDNTDPVIFMQARLRKRSDAPSSGQGLARDGRPGGVSTSQGQDDDLWSIYREVVDPIIQSLDSHYEELYPQLDGSAIRQEVC